MFVIEGEDGHWQGQGGSGEPVEEGGFLLSIMLTFWFS